MQPNIVYTPQQISALSNEVITHIGSECALSAAGDVWCWGMGNDGRIGDGDLGHEPLPKKVPGLSGVRSLCGSWGGNPRFAILQNGDVYAWGRNADGRLGNGYTQNVATPEKVLELQGFVEFFSGHASFGRKADGSTYVWGDNTLGDFGDGTTGMGTSTPVRAPQADDFVYIYSGSLAVDSSGQVWVSGNNRSSLTNFGLLGLGHNNEVLSPEKLGGIKALPRGYTAITGSTGGVLRTP